MLPFSYTVKHTVICQLYVVQCTLHDIDGLLGRVCKPVTRKQTMKNQATSTLINQSWAGESHFKIGQ